MAKRRRPPNRILTDTIREIRSTSSRFLSLMVLSALAVCFLSGLRATAPDMKQSADRYFHQQRLMDLRVVSTLGLTQQDIDLLTARPGVAAAEGGYTLDAIVPLGSNGHIVKVLSFTSNFGINAPRLVDGRMPQGPGECLVEPLMLEQTGLSIGDRITLETGEAMEDALASDEYTIVGAADSPLYISVERGSSSLGTGRVSSFVLLPTSAFTLDLMTDAYLLLEGAETLSGYSKEYETLVDEFTDNLKPWADQRAVLRGDSVRGEANETLADARQELQDAQAEVAQELSDAEQELVNARNELDDGWQEYYDGKETFDREIADALQSLQDGEQELQDALIALQDGEQAYQDALPDLAQAELELRDAKIELDDARNELDDGWQEYQDGRNKYEYGLILYQQGLSEYQKGLAQYQAGVQQLEAGIAQQAQAFATQQAQQMVIQSGGLISFDAAYAQVYPLVYAQVKAGAANQYAQLEAARLQLEAALPKLEGSKLELTITEATLKKAKVALEEGEEKYQDGLAKYQDGLREYQDGQQDVQEARKKLDEGWQEYRDGLTDLEEGRTTLSTQQADAQRELRDAQSKLRDGERAYRDGLSEYEQGKQEAQTGLHDAQKELEQAQRDVDALDECQWFLLDRNTNLGYLSYSMDADRMSKLADVFPLIFFLVAALVCLTTMTRMVEEQRTTIGGLKALGYSKGAIAVKYVGYGFLASAIGAALGLAVGLTLLPWIIYNAWTILYTLDDLVFSFFPALSFTAWGAAVGIVTLTALVACFSTLTAVPAQLMRPKTPPAGKRVLLERIAPVWSRLSFNYKVTIRNLFRYQKRFWMTVAGIGGCAALIVTAFGLRDSIFNILTIQFDELYHYSAYVGLVDQVTPEELREVEQVLDGSELVADWTLCRSESLTASSDAYSLDANLQVLPDQATLARFVTLRHRLDDEAVSLTDDGVVLSEKLASLLQVGPGDTFTLEGDRQLTVRVADVTEHYIQHYLYMTSAYYETLFGQPPQQNMVLVDYPNNAPERSALDAQLVRLDAVTSLSLISETRRTFDNSFESVDYAVVLVIVCAAALAFVVLYNLTNINMTERLRELATLKVLGFYDGELSAYVYRENVILTVFGTGAGMILGMLLHQWVILTVEIDMVMFGRSVAPMSYLYSVILTVLFSLTVNLAAHRKLKKLDMVQSLKTVE